MKALWLIIAICLSGVMALKMVEAQQCSRPLTRAQIERALAIPTYDEAIALEVRKCHLAFKPDAEFIKRLRGLKKFPQTVQAIEAEVHPDPPQPMLKTRLGDPSPPKPKSEKISLVIKATRDDLANLRAEDFEVVKDGLLQKVVNFTRSNTGPPLHIVMLYDISGSMRNRLDFLRDAAVKFLDHILRPQDSAAIFSISDDVKVIQNFTDKATLLNIVSYIQPVGDGTSLYDGICLAADKLKEAKGKRVIFILSDGEDTSSKKYKLGDALNQAKQADAMIFAINPAGPNIYLNRISVKGQEGLNHLAINTEGQAYLTDKTEDLDGIFTQLIAQLHTQYTLDIYPTNKASCPFTVQVKQPSYGKRSIKVVDCSSDGESQK